MTLKFRLEKQKSGEEAIPNIRLINKQVVRIINWNDICITGYKIKMKYNKKIYSWLDYIYGGLYEDSNYSIYFFIPNSVREFFA